MRAALLGPSGASPWRLRALSDNAWSAAWREGAAGRGVWVGGRCGERGLRGGFAFGGSRWAAASGGSRSVRRVAAAGCGDGASLRNGVPSGGEAEVLRAAALLPGTGCLAPAASSLLTAQCQGGKR